LRDEGIVILAGPTLGVTTTGVCVRRAPDEGAARAIMEADPVVRARIGAAELRPFHPSVRGTATD
jgi:uncharacterized protein YciI